MSISSDLKRHIALIVVLAIGTAFVTVYFINDAVRDLSRGRYFWATFDIVFSMLPVVGGVKYFQVVTKIILRRAK
jgi:hypothetical protein